jgi:mRNA-degrading endonuclease RelE of RelBE toxin-antitoxin system
VKLARTSRFARDFRSLPPPIQRRAAKQLQLLLANPRHPSLRLKKMEGTPNIWEGRITKGYRFTFQVQEDAYILRRIGAHDILGAP